MKIYVYIVEDLWSVSIICCLVVAFGNWRSREKFWASYIKNVFVRGVYNISGIDRGDSDFMETGRTSL